MDKFLRPDRLDVDPSSVHAANEWRHWFRTFENFMAAVESGGAGADGAGNALDKLVMLTNYISPMVVGYISSCSTYQLAIDRLIEVYLKPKSVIFSRHVLSSRLQSATESIDQYVDVLKDLAGECDFQAVDAETYKQGYIRDAFIGGLRESSIRERLLEHSTITLQAAITQARTLDYAQQNAAFYTKPNLAASVGRIDGRIQDDSSSNSCATSSSKCFFCGNGRHPRNKCPARNVTCHKCSKSGHFGKVCRTFPKSAAMAESTTSTTNTTSQPLLSVISVASMSGATVPIKLDNQEVHAMVDSGSSDSFIHPPLVDKLSLKKKLFSGENVYMASSTLTSTIRGKCVASITMNGGVYNNVPLFILPDLCSDVILGRDFMRQHSEVTFRFEGARPPLVCGLASSSIITAPPLFNGINKSIKPIATSSRRLSENDKAFVDMETRKLLKDGVIERSTSP